MKEDRTQKGTVLTRSRMGHGDFHLPNVYERPAELEGLRRPLQAEIAAPADITWHGPGRFAWIVLDLIGMVRKR